MSRNRTKARVAAIAALFATTLALPALAQRDRAPAEVQKEYDAFIANFRAALKSNKPEPVAALTKFPFVWQELRDEAYFRKTLYRKVFTTKIRACLARGKGAYARDGTGAHNYSIFCGEDIFLFTRTADGFRFAEIGVND